MSKRTAERLLSFNAIPRQGAEEEKEMSDPIIMAIAQELAEQIAKIREACEEKNYHLESDTGAWTGPEWAENFTEGLQQAEDAVRAHAATIKMPEHQELKRALAQTQEELAAERERTEGLRADLDVICTVIRTGATPPEREWSDEVIRKSVARIIDLHAQIEHLQERLPPLRDTETRNYRRG